ncbi:MAG TPA: AraC family transcriptional regulator, partial [Burkholderiaceae bacterium]
MTTTLFYRDAPRVAWAYLQPLLETVAEAGIARAHLLREAGLAADALDGPPPALPAANYLALLETGARLCADPHFGLHVGERVKLGTYNVYGLILLSCRDFGHALHETQRYERLAHDLGASSLSVDGALAHYDWHCHFDGAGRHLAESVYAGIRVFGNWLAAGALPSSRVSFRHPRPGGVDLGEYVRIFGSEPGFGAPCHRASFDSALLSMPVPNADPSLHPVLASHVERLLEQR